MSENEQEDTWFEDDDYIDNELDFDPESCGVIGREPDGSYIWGWGNKD